MDRTRQEVIGTFAGTFWTSQSKSMMTQIDSTQPRYCPDPAFNTTSREENQPMEYHGLSTKNSYRRSGKDAIRLSTNPSFLASGTQGGRGMLMTTMNQC